MFPQSQKTGKRIIFLYANQPLYRSGERYFAPTRNFVDFLAELAARDTTYRLIVPCRQIAEEETAGMTELTLPSSVLEVSFYRGHLAALLKTPMQAFKIWAFHRRARRRGRVVMAGPGPNSMLFWLSFLLPKSTLFAFFIRGDTVETVRHIFQDRWWGNLPVAVTAMFQQRIFSLLAQGRAIVFAFGEALEKKYRAHGPDVHRISPLIDESSLRKSPRPSIPGGRSMTLLFVGRLSAEKGLNELVASLACLRDRGIKVRLEIAGEGELKDHLKNRARDLGVADWVVFHGHVAPGPDLWALYDRCDLLCLPSRTEGTPRVVVEAFAREMPVLTTRVGSLPNMFPEALVFARQRTPEGLAEEIAWCDRHRERLSELGRKGRAGVDRFLLSRNVEYVDEILNTLMAGDG